MPDTLINVSEFEKLNVADTCAIWNILSSSVLCSSAELIGVKLCSTTFVRYECFHKRGTRLWPERDKLQRRLHSKVGAGKITFHEIAIEDLQDLEILRNRKKVSSGELSVIIFAKKTRQAVLTDDVGAQSLAREELGVALVQTTAHLFAWLYFNSYVCDSDKDQVKADLASFGRSIKLLDQLHMEAQRCKVLSNGNR